MLTLTQIRRSLAFKRTFGIPLEEGSCFGVTDPSRLRPPFPQLVSAPLKGVPRQVVVVDAGQRDNVSDDQFPEKK